MKSYLKFVGYNILILIGILAVIEVSINYLLNDPDKIPTAWVESMRGYYMRKDRTIFQYVPEFAQYDEALFYVLRPGSHKFSNREFETTLNINSFGLRDDEASLVAPKIICLGDSYTMGWGSNEDEIYSTLIENRTGLRTLNAGVSSYGTVREMLLLSQLNLDSLKYLVLQFVGNDNTENCAFFNNDNRFKVSARSEYESVVADHQQLLSYYPFKHISYFLRTYFEAEFGHLIPKKEESGTEDEAPEYPYVSPTDAFVNAFNTLKLDSSVTVILFQVGQETNDVLLNPLKEKMLGNDTVFNVPFKILDIQFLLTDEDYFLLDRHLTPNGNRIVGDTISKYIDHLEQM